ncbi:hypothetical protein SPRG_05326 [Saprolegnia parasitica CBS 223.65]|uniref:Uncharacterized protein n=1 Tax=Saprolegnia parasitica (strain CBS 223.65) TaxID=695850 RepID=A0A067CHC0_SAPPC|nr:hypothetical protein SPRG_05326 [Saprolegnia parasitica CBS 223.65]KDO30134.1 hypothetical protein SPRG_05326 [Saprolegnia parasitica CBS 223.65]|eukprot:XP_012199312.1 hypothetical protein SPRG_05326 [Saprolegnia parasitica CBS 223.65]
MSMSYSELGSAVAPRYASTTSLKTTPSKTSFSPRSALSVVKEVGVVSPPVSSVVKPGPTKTIAPMHAPYLMTESQQELTEIQQSVERLKKQRLQVEHIRHENERLEIELMRERGENRVLRQEMDRFKVVEADLEKQTGKLTSLEAKYDRLESAYREKRSALADAQEKRVALEKRWSQATDNLQRMVDETTKTYEAKVIALEDDVMDREAKVQQQQEDMDEMRCMHESAQMKLEKKIERLENANMELEKKYLAQIDGLEAATAKLEAEKTELDQKVASLVATTARQTAMIQECDRVICESEERMNDFMKRKNAQIKTQTDLEAKNHALEQKLKVLEIETKHELDALHNTNEVLQKQLDEKASHIADLESSIAENERLATSNQREMVVRERHRFHLDEANKELRKREKVLQSTIEGLEANLRDVVDDRKGLIERISALQDQLELERQDRARWASTRLRLLAQFCDEENKLSESLGSHHTTILSDLSD